jgi:AraC family transcriptional regulator, transcriptional activator of pobA
MSSLLQIKDKSENNRFLKAGAFRKGTRKTEPHKHNSYFELVYLSAGCGYHSIDNRRFEVRPPVLFFIRQDQVHHWDLEEAAEPEGWVLILKKVFFDQSLDGDLKDHLEKINLSSCIYLQDAAVIDQLLALIVQEQAREGGGSLLFVEGLLKGLFVKVLEAVRPDADHSKQRKELYRAFTELLLHERPLRNNVAYYAALLNTTPQNLNAVCRKAADRAAAEVLADYMID